MSSTNVGLAGEFYTLAQLAQRGIAASLTLANTKAVDILLFNAERDVLLKLEVKTTDRRAGKEGLFSSEPVFGWPMDAKHEAITDPRLLYCFVVLRGVASLPLFTSFPACTWPSTFASSTSIGSALGPARS